MREMSRRNASLVLSVQQAGASDLRPPTLLDAAIILPRLETSYPRHAPCAGGWVICGGIHRRHSGDALLPSVGRT